MTDPIPLEELLEAFTTTDLGVVTKTSKALEMARRLRKLDEAIASLEVSHNHIAGGLRLILEGRDE